MLTGALKRSIISEHDSLSSDRLTKLELEVGTEVSYAKYHQSRRPRSKIPRRPFLEFTERDVREWVRTIQRSLFVSRAR